MDTQKGHSLRLFSSVYSCLAALISASPVAAVPMWEAVSDAGVNGTVYAMTVFDDGFGTALYVGGQFSEVGGIFADNIAKWDGTKWSPVAGGTNGPVYALATHDEGSGMRLFAGGNFSNAGGVVAGCIARWNGNAWSAVGSGLNNSVNAMETFNGQLYAGGAFTGSSETEVLSIARWNGSAWSPLSNGVNGVVYCLRKYDDGGGLNLYVGGAFTTAGGVNADRIARWSGIAWVSAGPGLDNWAETLAVYDGSLYVGGIFDMAGGVSANGIARKGFVGWSALGGGLGSAVTASGVYNDDGSPNAKLFAGGDFTTDIGAPGNRIARWDGVSWSALGEGIDDGTVYALQVFQNRLYVGGSFSSIPGIDARGIARWTVPHRLYVDGSASGTNDGTSWANAYTTLQGALGAAGMINSGIDEIWVARGTYKPDQGPGITPGNRDATFQLINGVAIHGGFAGDETAIDQRNPSLNTTILSGDLTDNDTPVACAQDSPDCNSFGSLCVSGSCIISSNNSENSYHVVTGSGTDATALLEGFTITKGNADDLNGGGGMLNFGGSPIVTNCVFHGNSAQYFGGGMRNSGNATVTLSKFDRNWSNDGGGGMLNDTNTTVVDHCEFRNNATASNGGGMYNVEINDTVSNCLFLENTAAFQGGGGMYNQQSNPTVVNCKFIGNTAQFFGGGMRNNLQSSPAVINCAFVGNSTVFGGGMANHSQCDPSIVNCTFAGNSASDDGGGVYNLNNSSPELRNCIFWGNSDSGGLDESAQIHTVSGTPTVFFSIVQGGWTGAGTVNLNVDPLFFDPDGADNVVGTPDDDLRLRVGSLAIDGGLIAYLPADTLDLDKDNDTSEPIPFDLAGNERVVFGIVDIGALEYFDDCNNNGISDSTDIALGNSQDCNSANWTSNGIPDECDIALCSGNPGCDDCNLNVIPDGCDIGSGFSLDLNPVDGIPDECASFTDGCNDQGATQNWTCGDNWSLSGDYPDDTDSVAGVFATLPDGVVAFLNETVVIPSLRIEEGAELQVTQSGSQGDLQFSAPAVLNVEGNLLVSGARAVGGLPGVAPAVTVGPAGIYEADPVVVAGGAVSASLRASSLSVVGSDCFIPPCPHGGEVTLTESMTVTTTGDVLIDGGLANGLCQLHEERTDGPWSPLGKEGGRVARETEPPAVLSFHTPPSIRLSGPNSGMIVGGTVVMSGAAGFLVASTVPVQVGGDWENHSVRPDCFEAVSGTVRLNGATAQTFEVPATDTGGNGGSSDNFRIGTLEVAASGYVTLVDAFDNDLQGQASCGEAQYVDNLVLEAGATLAAQNCRLYYDTLTADLSAQIILEGCAEVRPAAGPPSPSSDPSGLNKSRSISFVPPSMIVAGGSPISSIRVTLVSLHHVSPPYSGGSSIPFTSFEGQVRWVGPPAQYVESTSTGTPFRAAALQCTPYYQDWSTVGLVHVFGSGITPSSMYRVQALASSCQGIEDHCTAVSSPLSIATTRWGDVETPYNPPSATTQPDLNDVASLVNKFKSVAGAPIKARALLAGDDAFGNILPATLSLDLGFGHIAACVDAFKGKPYPHTIQACP